MTDEQIRRLRELWPTHGARAIASQIGSTRATVVAQARRLDLQNPRSRLPWTPERETQLRQLWPQMSCYLIAQRMGITERSALAKAQHLGLPHRYPPARKPASSILHERWRSAEQKERVRAMRRQGLTLREIAEREGISRHAIAGLCYRMSLAATTNRPPRVRDKRRRAPVPVTELTIELPPHAPSTCQYIYGSPLRFCTNKRAIVAGRVSMYCKEHGVTIKPTLRVPNACA